MADNYLSVIPWFVVHGGLLLFLLLFSRILRESQRATTMLFGRHPIIKGPGIVLKFPFIHQDWRKHSVGDLGTLKNPRAAIFKDAEVPIVTDEDLHDSSIVQLKEIGRAHV